ncbi:MAG: hypothetical protein PHR89_00935 [Bacilli bacterium]|nr:hypothetical protein [Bacilli bacterium]
MTLTVIITTSYGLIGDEVIMSAGLFAQIVNIGLVVLFVLIIVGFVIAAFIGYKRGIWSSTYRMIFMLILVSAGLLSLSAIAEIIGNLNLDPLIPYETIVLTNAKTGMVYFAPITSFHETLVSCLRGFYYLYNVSGSYAAATEFAEALAYSTVKLVSFVVIMILIVTVGWLLSTILWHALFKRLIPKLARNKIKVRWAGAIMNSVSYVVVGFLLLSPLTSMVNIINQNYSRRNDDNQIVSYLNGFMDSYDNSLFAKTFFNWTVDSSSGLTLDATILNNLTSSSLENGSIGIISSVSELTNIASVLVENVLIGPNGEITYSIPEMINQEYIEALFASLKNSNLLMTIIPIAVQLSINSDLLADVVDMSMLDLSDAEWDKELDAIETITIDIANSGLVDSFMDEEGNIVIPSDPASIVTSLLTNKTYQYTYHALSTISKSKLLSRSIPALIQYFIANGGETMSAYFPASFEALNDIDWGFELSTIYDCLYQMYCVDDRIVTAILSMNSATPEGEVSGLSPFRAGEEPEEVNLMDVILENIDSYRRILVGETNSSNELINIDSNGRTIVYSNGNRIPGRRYCLLDISLCKTILSSLPQLLDSVITDETASAAVTSVIEELSDGKWMKNFKEEFNALFYCFSAFGDDTSALNTLLSGELIPEGGSLSDIDENLIKVLSKVLKRMDNSKIIYAILLPTIRSLLTSGSVADAFTSSGIDIDIVTDGIDKAEASRTLGAELAKVISSVKSIGTLTDILASGSDVPTLISQLGQANESIAYALDAIYSCRIINPIPLPTDTYTANENFLNVMSFIFGDSLNVDGLSFDQSLLSNPSIKWSNSTDSNGNFFHDRFGRPIYDGENGAIANVIRALGVSDIMTVMTDPNYLSGSNITANLASLENDYHLSTVLAAVGRSIVFSSTMGTFLDAQLQQTGILDQGVSFTNVTDWAEEGEKLGVLLTTIGEAAIDISNLDLNAVTNIVGLNNLLHSLADSSIFVDKTSGDYLFSNWLYAKAESSLTNFSDGVNTFNLLQDPSTWDPTWGEQGPDQYTIVKNDFASLNEKADWYNDEFISSFNTSIYILPFTSYTNYWDNPQFIEDYSPILELDEIGKICKIVYWVSQAVATNDLLSMPVRIFEGLINSLNDTTCLRVSTYNYFEVAKSAFTGGTSSAFFDLEPANTPYLISCDGYIYDYDTSQVLRQVEIEHLTEIYSTYRYMIDKGVLDSNNQFVTDMIDEEVALRIRSSIVGVQQSIVFHRKGSILDPDLSNDLDGYYPTVFQNAMGAFLTAENMGTIVYNANNPKDIFYYDDYAAYLDPDLSPVTEKDVIKAKSDYILDNYFDFAGAKNFSYNQQINEVNAIFTVIDAIVGGPIEGTNQKYQGLRKADGSITFSFENFDITNIGNALAVNQILTALNETNTMYDSVSNIISLSLENASQYDLVSSLTHVDFADANVFYHYFDEANLVGTQSYNWEAKFDEQELSLVCDILREVSKNQNGEPSAFPDLDTISTSSTSILNLQNFLHDLNESKIFHTGGPILSLYIDVNHNVVLNNASSTGMTIFQEICVELFSHDSISSSLFDVNSPKDQANIALGNYSNADQKAVYLAESLFAFDGQGALALSLPAQTLEIDNIADFMVAALDFNASNFNSMDLMSINTSDAREVLVALNDSNSLYDAVPNLIYTMMNRDFATFQGVDLSDASSFYHYEISGITNYNVKYDVDEIDNIITLVNDYQLFTGIVGTNDMEDLAVIKALMENGYIYDILVDAYASNILHSSNEYLASSTHMTVFEQVVNMFVSRSGLTNYAYPVNGDATMMAKIKAVTTLDEAYKVNVTTINTTGYHENWLRVTNNDEIHALVDFISISQSILGESGTMDVADLQMNNINPDETKTIMMAINKVDFLSDVLPVFVNQGLDAIGLNTLATYNSVSYSHFNIGQYQYGGDRSMSNLEFCEINNIYAALNNMVRVDGENNFDGYYGLNNLVALSENTDNFDGIIRFISHSRILNTDSAGSFNTMWDLSSYPASARGLLLYNILTAGSSNPSDGANLGQYITGATPEEKIATLSRIFTIPNYNDLAESKGLFALASNSDEIDSNNLNINDFNAVTEARSALTSSMRIATDAFGDSTNIRSYFASEIISSLLDQFMEIQYDVIDGFTYYYEEVHFGASSYLDIDEDVYNNVSFAECDGLNGAFDTILIINKIMSETIFPTRSELINTFTLMDNSQASKILYLARAHNNLGTITQTVPPTWSDYTANVYVPGFLFSTYGTSLVDHFALS